MRVLIIDDEYEVRRKALMNILEAFIRRARAGDEVEIVESPEFCDLEGYDVVMLDHDLGHGRGDVYDHLKERYAEADFTGMKFVVHSMNPVGAQNIANFCKDRGAWVQVRNVRTGMLR